jgi:hypothetical protein
VDGFLDTPKEDVDWVVTVSHHILLKFFYSIVAVGDGILVATGKISVFSF